MCGSLFFLLITHLFAQQPTDFRWRVDDRQQATITDYTGNSTAITIPRLLGGATVTIIANNAFANKGLTSVTISDSVTFIGSYAFINNQLTRINLPKRLEAISPGAFANNRLTSVDMPNGLIHIGSGAFANNLLINVNLPDSLWNIYAAAFVNNRLASVTIPDGVAIIEHGAFAYNPLISITIGARVELWWEVLGGNDSFDRAYIDGGRLAGTYTRPNAKSTAWTRK